MGTPLPQNEPGLVCPRCSIPGKPFHGSPTPKWIIVQLAGLSPGDTWNPDRENEVLSPFYVKQGFAGCFWQTIYNDWDVTLAFGDVSDTLFVNDRVSAKRVFQGVLPADCNLFFASGLFFPTNNYAFGGTATITWIPFS